MKRWYGKDGRAVVLDFMKDKGLLMYLFPNIPKCVLKS